MHLAIGRPSVSPHNTSALASFFSFSSLLSSVPVPCVFPALCQLSYPPSDLPSCPCTTCFRAFGVADRAPTLVSLPASLPVFSVQPQVLQSGAPSPEVSLCLMGDVTGMFAEPRRKVAAMLAAAQQLTQPRV